MKNNNFNKRNIAAVLAFAAITLSTGTAVNARTTNKDASIAAMAAAPKTSVEFLKNTEDAAYFKVNFDAGYSTKVELNITDDRGELLYSTHIDSASFTKYIKLVNEGFEAPSKIYFTLRELPNGRKHIFSVDNIQTYVHTMVITKL